MIPESIRLLIESFKFLPGIGEKTAERLAFSILDLDDEQVNLFSQSIIDVNSKIHRCKKCNLLSEKDICDLCLDDNRDNTTLCVVEDSRSVFLFEKLGMYNGRYHVLDGLISPLDSIYPEDIGLSSLLKRIEEEKIEEVIFAFKSNIEGETTSLYIKKILDDLNIKFTRLASGVPVGADMEYIDRLTLERAINDRKIL